MFSAKSENKTENIMIICHNLNGTKKTLISGKRYNILGIINLNEIKNWLTIKGESIYVSASLTDVHNPEKADHSAPAEILEFLCELIDDKGISIKFYSQETKIPVFDFVIDILK